MEYKLILIILINNLDNLLSQKATSMNNEYNYSCVNPNKQTRLCISLYYCPTFLNISTGSAEEQRFFQESKCNNGFGPPPHVCCSEKIGFIKEEEAIAPNNLNNLLAGPDDCIGRYSEYNYGGRIADIRDYHWLALIGKKDKNGLFGQKCTGSLISHHYVLTSGTCGYYIRIDNSINIIRLGEYDLNKEIDCQDDICLDPVIDVGFEKIFFHPNFLLTHKSNDLALLRLEKEIPYNANISPICLPSVVGHNVSLVGEGLFFAGWGSQGTPGNARTIKAEVNLPIFEHQNCTAIYKDYLSFVITDFQLCAGGGEGYGTCYGDDGGPLVKKVKHKWVVEGVYSFGILDCSSNGQPSIFTVISKYEDWIKSIIQS